MAPTVLVEYTKEKKLKKSSQNLSFTMMGKTQRFSKGFSSGFVPDYRHAVETVGESEGFGSSGRVDSEDLSAPKRKCMSLNADRSNGFNVPMQVISIYKMSSSERKDLEMRLRADLDQIQMLQKKIHSMLSNGAAISSMDVQGKKCQPVGQNTPQLKRGLLGRFEKHGPPPNVVNNADALLMKQCEVLLNRLLQHQFAWVFNSPVDVVKLNIPDYLTIIKHPMDLGTVKSKIASGSYSSPWGFVSDVRLTFTNAKTYNPPGNDVHKMADTMSKYFEMRWKSIEKKLPQADPIVERKVKKSVKPVAQLKKRKAPSESHTAVVPVSVERVKKSMENVQKKMTAEEKQDLSSRLVSLPNGLPEDMIDFLRKHSGDAAKTSEDEMEIDIDALKDDVLFELRKLLDDYLQEKGTEREAKPVPSEMENFNESGLSNSSMHPCKGNELQVDEEVDIVDNDIPVSSYPPVEIEKDTALRSSKCSSSSSSSSDSGSSSSDSDSASSSGSELDVVKAFTPMLAVKGTVAGAALDQERSDIHTDVGNRFLGGLDLPEQNTHPKALSVEVDGRQEGENAPSERQVSPEKLYRAALLRSRFADTILKAREKTLDQGEKGDPKKLRREREELERQQREERARLLAEAKAAEDARRQAEAEAAAEAKRKRELEREAARQALLKMEKTVDINENSQFLKDLEMLRTAPAEPLLSSLNEASPDLSQDDMGGFKLGGSNPLEQLGLYMKVDDEEEEEVEPGGVVAPPVNDVEEGEIDLSISAT